MEGPTQCAFNFAKEDNDVKSNYEKQSASFHK